MLARWRLFVHRLAGHSYATATDAVAGLLAVQAENPAQASWAVADRSVGVSDDSLAALLDQGEILRTHVLRPTWHFVGADDIRWLVQLTAPRVRRTMVQVQRSLGVDDAMLDQSSDILATALAGANHLVRDEAAAVLADAGLPVDAGRVGLFLTHAELSDLVCSGMTRDGEHTWALLDERAPHARRLDRDEALAELTLRYFTGHGPATERDLAYWASLTLGDVRAGLATVADELASFEHDGRTYWHAEVRPSDGAVAGPRAHVLQTLDELHNGYQDSRYALDADRILPKGRLPSVGMVLVDGQFAAGHRRSVTDDRVTFELDTYRSLPADELDAIEDAAARCGKFLGRPALVITA